MAIEVHRASDLSVTEPHVPSGKLAWRAMQLRARGLHVIEVDGIKWEPLTLRARAKYLQRLLQVWWWK